MKVRKIMAIKIATALTLMMSLAPSIASAQAAGGGGGGMGGLAVLQQVRQVLAQLDLSDDQKTKIQGIVRDALQSGRETMQGLADATQQERVAKLQDLQKLMTDTLQKVEGDLTPEQKAKFYPLLAKVSLKQMTDLLAALKTAAAKQDLTDDQKKQLDNVFDDSQKTLDGYKSDAEAVTDEAGETDFAKKIAKFQLEVRQQIVAIIGQQDAQTLMQSARQGMRGNIGARPARPAKAEATPTSTPVVQQ